ncbi:putative transcriptional activator Myb, partial [Patellaria atrata CBS 101060]
HDHHLPHQPSAPKMARPESGQEQSHGGGAPSAVGLPGMPAPAPKPRGPKLKFTPEDDQLLVDLKEKKNLTWKQIAEFFPGRSSGTLQVRYCTKLKAKTTNWTDEMVEKLRHAMHDYEQDKWRIIAAKVGSGFSPVACRDKASEL